MASEHGCPIEMHQIKIDKCDEMYDESCQGDTTMPFHRARYDPTTGQSPNSPREQVKNCLLLLMKYFRRIKIIFYLPLLKGPFAYSIYIIDLISSIG